MRYARQSAYGASSASPSPRSRSYSTREALHLIELRSGREGHPSYRAVAHEMRRQIAAVHPNVATAMRFVDDSTEERLERLLSEMRNESRG